MEFKTITLGKILVIAWLMMVAPADLFSQEQDSSQVRPPGLFVGFTAGSGQSAIANESTSAISGLTSGVKTGSTGSIEVGCFFSKHFGLSTGIGFTSFRGEHSLASYQDKYTTRDSENESYERRISGNGITENQQIGWLDIPVLMNLRLPFSNKISFALQTGIEASFPAIKKYSSTGIFTYKGYYPAYNVLLENLPAYGFQTNAGVSCDGKLELKPLCLSALVTAGLEINLQRQFSLGIAARYVQSLSNISAYTSPENFHLSTDAGQISSFMGGSSKATVQSVGVQLSLKYFLSAR